MYCKYCGAELRENVKCCTHCGKPVNDEKINILNSETAEKIKEQAKNVGSKISENIKNIDTEKIKGHVKDVSNNIVENVKNFDKDQAKQQTINFTNNVKTDLKNFKTIGRKKQIIYIVSILLIFVLLFSIFNGGGNSYSEKSDNVCGMRFKKTISEFCDDYNKSITKINRRYFL